MHHVHSSIFVASSLTILGACAQAGDGDVLEDVMAPSDPTGPSAQIDTPSVEHEHAAVVGSPSTTEVVCGDGIVMQAQGELCDDNNPHPGDGCNELCQPEPGYCCQEGVGCIDTTWFLVSEGLPIPDDAYDGSMASMACVELNVAGVGNCNFGAVRDLDVELAMDHPSVGELTIKLISPMDEATTLLSLPGFGEIEDNGAPERAGHPAPVKATSPIRFDEDWVSSIDAELMGNGLEPGEAVCEADNRCDYIPNAGAGPGLDGLDDFSGEAAGGLWYVCVGDSEPGNAGSIARVELSYLPQ